MIFNSIEFAFFLPIVFLVYWFVVNKDLRYQNMWLLVASYFFYGWWDWRFLSLIAFSSLVDYFIGIQLGKETEEKKRKRLLLLSVFVNLGFLGVFKYFDFFAQSFVDAFTFFGGSIEATRLDFVLPVGISFYTFQTLSYSIDIYKRKLEPTHDIIHFFAFVSFFPQLVAGPIERATNLLPQFAKRRVFDQKEGIDGMRQILWGLFKKVVIADNCALFVNDVFAHYDTYPGNHLMMAAVYFAIQIYCDFSGYSDIAIGTGRLFGFKLMKNFSTPYFSKNITELWRRWHISLSTWFGDYLYNPIAFKFRYYGLNGLSAALLISFAVIGFWHGAGWTFIVFGLLHGIALVYELQTKKIRKKIKKKVNLPIYNLISIGLTLIFWGFTLIFFRSPNINFAVDYITKLVTGIELNIPPLYKRIVYLNVIGLLVIEWFNQNKNHPLENLTIPKFMRWSIYLALFLAIYIFGGNQQQFIYFQF